MNRARDVNWAKYSALSHQKKSPKADLGREINIPAATPRRAGIPRRMRTEKVPLRTTRPSRGESRPILSATSTAKQAKSSVSKKLRRYILAFLNVGYTYTYIPTPRGSSRWRGVRSRYIRALFFFRRECVRVCMAARCWETVGPFEGITFRTPVFSPRAARQEREKLVRGCCAARV